MDSQKITSGKRPYLDRDEYAWTYYEAQKQARLFFLPFNEYERLADNDVREDLPDNMPKVNDGSLSDLLEKTVERVLGQMFSGTVKVVESIDPETNEPTYPQPWLQEVANFVWDKKIVPNANAQAPFFRKMQIALKRALTYGSCPIYSFYTSNGSYRGADMALPYIRDVYLEVGKTSDRDSDYVFMDSYYTRLQLARVIAQANRLEEQGVDSKWDIPALKKIYDAHLEQQKEYLAKNKAERNRPVRATQIKFTTVFQRGVNAPFDTFYGSPGLDAGRGSVTIVRSKINEDPTGDVPIHFLYAYDDLVNPYGVGQIKRSGGTQNALDYLMQLYILAAQLGLQPPILIEGETTDTDLKSMIYAPSQFWFTGGARVDIMETGSTVYREFPQAYGLVKSNLVNAQGQAPIDVSGESGSPTNSKVPAAVKRNQATLTEFDNHHRTQVLNTYRLVVKSMLNIHFANMQGEDLEKIEADDAIKLTRAGLIEPDPNNPNMPSTQEIVLDWDNLRGKFDIDIDADSVIYKDNQEQITSLTSVLQMFQENPYMAGYIEQSGYKLQIGEIYRAIITKLGLQNADKILAPMSAQDKANASQLPPVLFDKPKIDLRYDMLPPAIQLQMMQRLGYQVSMLDILMGPVLDPNQRGVYKPQDQPGNAQNPISPDAATLAQENGGKPVPMPPEATQTLAPKNSVYLPNPNVTPPAPAMPAPPAMTGGIKPETAQLRDQIMQQHGVDERGAMAFIAAKAHGIQDQDIINHMKRNGIGKYGANSEQPPTSGRKPAGKRGRAKAGVV